MKPRVVPDEPCPSAYPPLLVCEKPKGHEGRHRCGYATWGLREPEPDNVVPLRTRTADYPCICSAHVRHSDCTEDCPGGKG